MPEARAISSHWKNAFRQVPVSGRNSTLLPALVAALVLVAVAADARVYWLGGRGNTGGLLAADSAWSRAYSTMVQINGGRGGMEIWNARFSMDETMSTLRAKMQQAGGALWVTGGDELAWAIGCDGENVYRYLVSAGQGPRQCLVFQLTQTFDDFKASLQPPTEHLLEAAPAYPGSQEKSFIASEKTKTAMASSTTGDTPGDVKNFYAQQLSAAGWSNVFQPGKGIDVYLRGNEIVVVSTETAGDAGGSLIMVLHKPLSSGEGQ